MSQQEDDGGQQELDTEHSEAVVQPDENILRNIHNDKYVHPYLPSW